MAGVVLAALGVGCGSGVPGTSRSVALAADAEVDPELADIPSEPPLLVPPEDPPAPGLRSSGMRTLAETRFTAGASGEGTLVVHARGPGTDWAAGGRESAAVSVYLDGAHNQDLVLHRGDAASDYPAWLGPVSAGEHHVTVRYRPELSSPGARGAEVASVQANVVHAGDAIYEALAAAPILYARPDAYRSDTPLFLAYEHLATGLRYQMYASNEDGGTPAADLMAVWGRACDIDWVYRQGAAGAGGYFQGFWHRQLAFRGRYEAGHPYLRISTTNNMVSDQGTGRYKLRLPLVAAPAVGARERALDGFEWVYRLTAVELAREGKVRPVGEREPLMSRILGKRIGDMRRYVTLEFEHPGNGARLGFRLQLAGRRDWLLSTGGRFYRAIRRGGVVRTTIELPPGASPAQIARLEPITQYGKPYPGPVRVIRAFAFDERYQPVPLPARPGLASP